MHMPPTLARKRLQSGSGSPLRAVENADVLFNYHVRAAGHKGCEGGTLCFGIDIVARDTVHAW